jgi:hypothetical protein
MAKNNASCWLIDVFSRMMALNQGFWLALMNEGDDDLDSIVAAGSTYVCVGMLNFSRPRKHGQLARPRCLAGIIAVILASLRQVRGLRHSGQVVRHVKV